MYPGILSMSSDATGKMAFSLASGLITRPWLSEFFLMYTQIFFVTSVRGIVFPPQIAASASLSFFGAKMPTPFFLPFALAAFLPAVRFSAVIFLSVAFVGFVFVAFAVVVVVVIAIEGCKWTKVLSLEP